MSQHSHDDGRASSISAWPLTATESGLAFGLAIVWVTGLSLLTPPIIQPVIADGLAYTRMAAHGFMGYEGVAAPFAYRPSVPALAHALSFLFDLDVPKAFRLMAHLASMLVLFLSYVLARSVGSARQGALGAMSLVALSHFIVRGPLSYYTLIDIETLSLVMLAMVVMQIGYLRICLAICVGGLLVKEWLIVPLVVAAVELVRTEIRERRAAVIATLAIAAITAAVVLAMPRLIVPAPHSFSSLARIHDFGSLVDSLWQPRRLLNLVFVWACFWLPSLMLLTRERALRARSAFSADPQTPLLYCAIVLALMLLGGSNLMIFVTYSLPIQVIVLSRLMDPDLRRPISSWELTLAFGAVIVLNKSWMPVPQGTIGMGPETAWLDFYGGWSTRLTSDTGWRALQMLGFVAMANALRYAGGVRRRSAERSVQ